LAIFLKHTPKDYTAISQRYFNLFVAYKVDNAWQTAIECLTKAIETARLSDEPNRERIRQLEADREAAMEHIVMNEPVFSVSYIQPNPGESADECRHRAVATMCAYNAEHGTLRHDISEITRIPDKQTESQVTDEILNEVLNHLVKDIRDQCASPQNGFGSGWSEFLVVNFKLAHMETSPLSPAIIEAALTMIIDRLNSGDIPNDERYTELKQAPVQISYRDESMMYKKGVRVLVYKAEKKASASE